MPNQTNSNWRLHLSNLYLNEDNFLQFYQKVEKFIETEIVEKLIDDAGNEKWEWGNYVGTVNKLKAKWLSKE